MKYQNMTEVIGNTPHLKINRLFGSDHEVWVKLERQNPGASIKDRIDYDLYYIENWSVLFDLYILFKTPFALIKGENAY